MRCLERETACFNSHTADIKYFLNLWARQHLRKCTLSVLVLMETLFQEQINVIREMDATHESPVEKQMLLSVKMFHNITQ
jgi:hypothetical protein